ncbi:MAG: 4'-phosphopantetheinyl transferase superfamily protein [Saprospirales bacterium]|nr:4'-phosphopantetheinyl transferase superfamily protein [Saprospirales bacterium]
MKDLTPVHYSHQTITDLPFHLDWLHPSERHFLESLKFEKRRNDWLLGRWTAKVCMGAFLEKKGIDFSPQTLAILRGSNGAPEMHFEGDIQPCSLSISHRAGHAIAVVATGQVAIGCDLELIEPRSPAFLSDYFLDRELGLLADIPPDQKDIYVNLLWCVKESVMKATGEGMKLHPRKIEVQLEAREDSGEWNPVFAEVDSLSTRFEGWWKREREMISTFISAK